MDLDSLKLFLHLSETLHFGKTSRECFITPSGLSRIIQRLEKETGQQLFIRDNRRVLITPAGRLFKEYASDALNRWRLFRERTTEEELQGEINIYCSVTAAYGVLHGILDRFRAEYPKVHIKLKTGEESRAVRMLQDRAADISVAARPDMLPDDIDFLEHSVTPLLFIAPECGCYASDRLKTDWRSWWDLPLILPEQGLARERVEDMFRVKMKKMNVYADVSGNEAIIAMVSLGCGIGVVPGLVLDQSPLKDGIRVLEIKPALKPYRVGFCTRKTGIVPAPVRVFWEICGSLHQ